MPRQEYYRYSNTYEYAIEFANEDSSADEVSGEVTWDADITWNESLGQYKVDMSWNDHGNHFSRIGEGPKNDDFLDDLYSYMESQGIGSEEVTY